MQAAYCDRPLAEYRRHSGSLSHHDLRGHMAALDYIYEKNAELLAALEPDIRAQVTQAYQEWVTHTFLAPVERGIAAAGAAQLDTTYGEHLIFLLGLPWSGATLLQHALNRHTQIHALNEADILLPVIDLVNAPDATPRMAGLRRFLDTLPEGGTAYLEYARQFASGLYRQALVQTGKTLCLDRTSSYADQFAEIRRLFP